MHKTLFGGIIISFLLLTSCQSTSSSPDSTSNTSKPNFLFLFTDDQTFNTINALGNKEIHTPNLDRLVAKGASFSNVYNMGGWHGAVCVASRSMIISGQSVWRAKAMEPKWRQKDSITISNTWGRIMAQHGYETYLSGKWHVLAPSEMVFDHVKHERPGMPPDSWGRGGGGQKVVEAADKGQNIAAAMPVGYNRPIEGQVDQWSPTDTTFGGFWEGGQHWSEVVKLDALEFLAHASSIEKPFFMYLAFNAPHDPRQAPQSFLDLYDINDIPVFPNFLPEYPWKDAIGCSMLLRDEALAPFPRTPFAIKKHLKEYYAIISHLDQQLGEILDGLENAGMADNTYIFFTADHGLGLGQHGLVGKQNLFDHSIRVPLIAAGPNIPEGKIYSQDIYLQDIMPTTLELAGIDIPSFVDFNSFWGVIQEEELKSSYNSGIYGCYMQLQRMIRKDGYKLLVYPKIGKVLLFDLEKDPHEMNDLSGQLEQQERIETMFKGLMALQQEMQDTLDLGEIYKEVVLVE